MQENLKKKYGITDEELKRAINQIPLGKIACDGITIVAVTDLICNGDVQAPTGHTMREFIKENLDKILEKFFQKNCFCCICDNLQKCKEDFKLHTCEVNANVSIENGKKFLDSEATPDNIAKLKEIYEELLFGEV